MSALSDLKSKIARFSYRCSFDILAVIIFTLRSITRRWNTWTGDFFYLYPVDLLPAHSDFRGQKFSQNFFRPSSVLGGEVWHQTVEVGNIFICADSPRKPRELIVEMILRRLSWRNLVSRWPWWVCDDLGEFFDSPQLNVGVQLMKISATTLVADVLKAQKEWVETPFNFLNWWGRRRLDEVCV